MKRTFLTVCTNDKYLYGVLALNESLKQVKSSYTLTVLLTEGTSLDFEDRIKKNGIEVRRISRKINLPDNILEKNNNAGFSHWNHTLQKLCMFELDEFEKIVYLDSDMIVLDNIDELFDKPHMSAVVAGKSYPGNESWKKLNSGCLVIEPKKGLLDEFIKIIPTVIEEREYFGDQDILQVYYNDWEYSKELELDEKYNIFFPYLDYYVSKLGYEINVKGKRKNISIVHFIGNSKPWMKNNLEIVKEYIYLIKAKRFKSLKILIIYRKILKKVYNQ